MGKQRCWSTCHHSARDAATDTWQKGRCPHNRRLDNDTPALPGCLVKCTACGKCTCVDCLDELQRESKEVIAALGRQGLTMEPFEALEWVLAGSHRELPAPASGAMIAAEVPKCVWCVDRLEPDVVGAKEPMALLKEIGIDPGATYAKAKPAMSQEKTT